MRKYGEATYEELEKEANRLRVENRILKEQIIIAESALNSAIEREDGYG